MNPKDNLSRKLNSCEIKDQTLEKIYFKSKNMFRDIM